MIHLSEVPLFCGVKETEIDELLACLEARRRKYRKGETILSEGTVTEMIGVVLSGRVMIESFDAWGGSSILGSAAPGDVFAEAYACVPNEPLLISVQAAEDTEVLFLNVGRMLTVCREPCGFHTVVLKNLLAVCAQKSLSLSRRILHTGPKTIRGRLMSYFSECEKRAGARMFDLPYSRQQLADYLGVDRSAMCHELSKMQRDGLIEYHRNTVRICGAAQ